MERYAKVGMQELDQRLSKIVEAARKKPVSVYRYGAPWVWIVSQDDWQGALKEVSSYIPPGHSLVLLRPQIDALLDQHRDILQGLDAEPGMLIAPRTVMHILLLQLLYSVPGEQQLYEQLNYNLLFRWFVGLDLNQKVWSLGVLSRDIATLLNDARAVLLIQKIIGEVFCGALLQMPEFSLNFALLHSWLAKHATTSTLSN
ncbi:Transposase [Pseudomonas sp. NFPP07]|jgi:transposase|nr:prevent-host-death protein [Pseudomonas chlororaphis]EJL06521.1 prevent-host-death family protein [Pseudomonas chlororaphis subsp. aureofaciens 30-84]KAB0531879.1 transposase [Pseudomonas chlororaphis subsp. aureofaciens]NNA95906.1 transposase [Pseudomonas gessardii]PMY43938.1 transposase [Pseudomonas sp. FW306-2-2C-D06C]POA65070.1 transposase [Pseudomonas sp. GW531-T4]PWY40099.1 transposase [Pseudomonas sp. RW409]TSD32886.1 transposase [Pseudomonas sp. ATCC 13985]SFQ23032.1 Transposase 